MGVIGNAVPFHVVIFAGGRTVQVQPLHTWIVRTVQHFLHREHAESAGTFQFSAEYPRGAMETTVTAYPQQLLPSRNVAEGPLQNDNGARLRTSYVVIARLLRLFIGADQLFKLALRLDIDPAFLISLR